jgi:hypothetical protein
MFLAQVISAQPETAEQYWCDVTHVSGYHEPCVSTFRRRGTVSKLLGPGNFPAVSLGNKCSVSQSPPLPHLSFFGFQKLNFTERMYNFVQEDAERIVLVQTWDVRIGGPVLPKTRLSWWIASLIKTCLVWASSASGFCNCPLKKKNFVNYWRKFLHVSRCSEARRFKGHVPRVSRRSLCQSVMVHNVTISDILLLNVAVP